MWAINIKTGKSIWEQQFPEGDWDLKDYYQFDSLISFHGLGGNLYSFNIKERVIQWKSNINVIFYDWLSGLDSLFFACGYSEDVGNPYKINSAWVGNIFTGEIHNFYTPKMENVDLSNIPWNGIGGVEHIVPFYNNGNLFSLIFQNRYTNDGNKDSSNYGLYNFSDGTWIYKNKSLFKNRPERISGNPIVLDNTLVINTTSDLYRLDLLTGEIIWKTNYNDAFSWYGPKVADGKVFALIEGAQSRVVCHDLISGSRLWTTPVAGVISTIEYLNGIVYFASMGDGRLYALDASNGNLLWRIKPPDSSGLKFECAVIPGSAGEKGKVIVSTFLNGYCYEAER
jgi:outer membrane protein assembly factor BamB